jgi:hypothetical protein
MKDNTESRGFEKINNDMYVRKTENFVVTLKKKELHSGVGLVHYTLITFKAWMLEIREKNKIEKKTLAVFNTEEGIEENKDWSGLEHYIKESILRELKGTSIDEKTYKDTDIEDMLKKSMDIVESEYYI